MAERIRTVTPADLVDPAISVDELLKRHLEAEAAAEFTAQIDAAIQEERTRLPYRIRAAEVNSNAETVRRLRGEFEALKRDLPHCSLGMSPPIDKLQRLLEFVEDYGLVDEARAFLAHDLQVGDDLVNGVLANLQRKRKAA